MLYVYLKDPKELAERGGIAYYSSVEEKEGFPDFIFYSYLKKPIESTDFLERTFNIVRETLLLNPTKLIYSEDIPKFFN